MVTLYFEINNINSILELYDQIEIVRFVGSSSDLATPVGEPSTLDNWVTVSGSAPYTAPVSLLAGTTAYYVYDIDGNSFDWYSSRYVKASDPSGTNSGWATPVLGDGTALYRSPLYPSEVTLTSAEKNIVDRIRLLIGDPAGLKREAGEEAIANLFPDGRVYSLEEKGWPVSVNMSGVQYTELTNPIVNGYKYLKFTSDVSAPTTVSGVTYSVDVWYYSFRFSDKEILDTYDRTPVPEGLTVDLATTDSYIIACAIDMLSSELWLDATEDGALIHDDRSVYDPSSSLNTRRQMLEDLRKRLGNLVKSLITNALLDVSGVLID